MQDPGHIVATLGKGRSERSLAAVAVPIVLEVEVDGFMSSTLGRYTPRVGSSEVERSGGLVVVRERGA